MSLVSVSPAPEMTQFRAGAQEPCERVPLVGRTRAALTPALKGFPLLCVSLVTPLQDSSLYRPSAGASSYSSYEDGQCHLPASSQPQLPATATLCQPGGPLHGGTGLTVPGAAAKSHLKLCSFRGGPGVPCTSGLSSWPGVGLV